MECLTKHTWVLRGWKFWVCSKCGAERYWDKILQRIVYVKYSKTYYSAPDCCNYANGDKPFKAVCNVR